MTRLDEIRALAQAQRDDDVLEEGMYEDVLVLLAVVDAAHEVEEADAAMCIDRYEAAVHRLRAALAPLLAEVAPAKKTP